MVKRARKTEAEEETAEKRKRGEDDEKESEDWCFVCKDGGTLHICDREDCAKAYHSGCLKRKKLLVPIGELSWHCSRHTCSECHDPSTFYCFCCPTSVCQNCVDATDFLLIRKQHGFCQECRTKALFLENKKVVVKRLSRSMRLFKEYYEIVKKDEGLILKNLESPKVRSEMKQKHKSSGGDNIGGPEKAPKFASIVSENIRLVYLKRNLIRELLKEPESFERKVKGSYVRVPSTPGDGHQNQSFQLMQVTDVKKCSSGLDGDIRLQLLDLSDDICINSLSDANFSEAECKDLRHKMEVGLLKKPTLDEFGEKARSLHKDLMDHRLAIEKRTLQNKIDFANEKVFTLFQLLEERRRLETPSYRLQLLNTPPKVIPEGSGLSNDLIDASENKSFSKENYHECSGNRTGSEQSASNPGDENLQNLTSAASISDMDLGELDQLIKPNVSCSSADVASFEEVKYLEEGLILLLKKVPISDFKIMITMANGFFKCFHQIPINYSSFYERIRNYICYCSLLASTEQFKRGSCMEKLAARYDSGKQYNEMIHKNMKELSTSITETFRRLGDLISNKEKLFLKFETERCVCGTERQSRTLREISEKLKKIENDIRCDLESPAKSKKQCHFEEVWEAFLNAKAALGL